MIIKDQSIYVGDNSPYAKKSPLRLSITPPKPASTPSSPPLTGTAYLKSDPLLGGLPRLTIPESSSVTVTGLTFPQKTGSWEIKATEADIANIADELKVVARDSHVRLNIHAIEDLLIVCHYTKT